MSKLLPCPFCGNEASSWESPPRGLVVECMNSDCCLYDANEGHGISADQWNTRHAPEGWQLVPVNPTEDMLGESRCARALVYQQMLSAAPRPNGTPSHAAETTDNQESGK